MEKSCQKIELESDQSSTSNYQSTESPNERDCTPCQMGMKSGEFGLSETLQNKI